MKTYVTFGFDHKHIIADLVIDHNCVAVVEGNREEVFRIFKNKFSFESLELPDMKFFPRGLVFIPKDYVHLIKSIAGLPCPFCGSEFRMTDSHLFGCSDPSCPEHPVYHDPVGREDLIYEFWVSTQNSADDIKEKKRKKLTELTTLVEKYYA